MSSPPSIALDISGWPFVVTTLRGELSDEAMRAYLDDFARRVLKRDAPFASIVDVSAMQQTPGASIRRLVAAWQEAHAEVGSRLNVGIAFVSASPLFRGAMTALQWLSPSRVPSVYEASLPEAMAWARARLIERGVSVP